MTLAIIVGSLILSAGLYGAIAYSRGTKINSIRGFYHIDEVRGGVVTIVAGNLTLGTGLVYMAGLAQKQAAFAILAPIGVYCGYKLLSWIASIIKLSPDDGVRNILDYVGGKAGGKIFHFFVSLIIVLTFIIILPFEIYVSSNLLASLLAPEDSAGMSIVFATVIFVLTLLYSMLGGLRGVVATDYIQIGFIILMLLALFIVSIFPGLFLNSLEVMPGQTKSIGFFPDGEPGAILFLVIISFITAVSTQVYNIVNLSVSTSYTGSQQSSLFSKVGLGLSLSLFVFAAVGFSTNALPSSDFGGIDHLLREVGSGDGLTSKAIVFAIVFGMVAVLISSADSFIVSVSQMFYGNLLKKDTYSSEGGKELWWVRFAWLGGVNLVSVIPLLIIFDKTPDVVGLLLTSISALTVTAPVLLSAVVNKNKFGSTLLENVYITVFVMVFICIVWVAAIADLLYLSRVNYNYIIFSGVVLSGVFYLIEGKILESRVSAADRA